MALVSPFTGNELANKVNDKLDSNGGSINGDLIIDGNASINGATDINGVLNMNGNRVTSVATPTTNTDVVNKNYVDNGIDKLMANINYEFVAQLTGDDVASGVIPIVSVWCEGNMIYYIVVMPNSIYRLYIYNISTKIRTSYQMPKANTMYSWDYNKLFYYNGYIYLLHVQGSPSLEYASIYICRYNNNGTFTKVVDLYRGLPYTYNSQYLSGFQFGDKFYLFTSRSAGGGATTDYYVFEFNGDSIVLKNSLQYTGTYSDSIANTNKSWIVSESYATNIRGLRYNVSANSFSVLSARKEFSSQVIKLNDNYVFNGGVLVDLASLSPVKKVLSKDDIHTIIGFVDGYFYFTLPYSHTYASLDSRQQWLCRKEIF